MITGPSFPRRRLLATGAAGAAATGMAGLSLDALAGSPGGAGQSAMPPATVSRTPSQTMQGFGAAGAWWPNDLVHFDRAVQETVADMLFGRDGIALSVYRYSIGGGGVGVTVPARAPETFLVAPGVYDWTRDPGGQRFLRLAAGRGVPILIGFVNSAPAVWTTNEESRGGYLQPGSEAAYGAYLADIVTHFHDAGGITLSYVSPMNEPDYRFSDGSQEGIGVPVEQRADVIEAVGRQLAARAPSCQVIADESSQVGTQFIRAVRQWLSVPGAAEHVAALAQHRYDFPNDLTLQLARELCEGYDKPLWWTETCCFDTRSGAYGQQYDPTIRGALMLANLIWQGLTVANDAAFHWWVACSSELGCDPLGDPEAPFQMNEEGWNDGLLYYDPDYAENGNQQIYATKRYYALGNFSRYVRPGARRHEVLGGPANLHILAFAVEEAVGQAMPQPQQPAGPIAAPPAQRPAAARVQRRHARVGADVRWSLVLINNARIGSGATTVSIQLPVDHATRLVASEAVETSDDRSLEPVTLPHVSATGLLTAEVPAASITSFVLGDSDAT